LSIQSIETKALRIYEISQKVALLDEEKDRLKRELASEMSEGLLDTHLLGLDGLHDIKISVTARTTKKVDVESLADDLGISKDAAGKKDVLIKKVEEGRLTHSQYKQYEYEETKESISVRRVKA